MRCSAQAVFTGLTNGTERNQIVGGNYSAPDDRLPAGGGYQNVGRVIETGPDVTQLQVGDLIYASVDHVERFTIPEDGLLLKLPEDVDPADAALFGISGVAMHCCRRIDPRIGRKSAYCGTRLHRYVCSANRLCPWAPASQSAILKHRGWSRFAN